MKNSAGNKIDSAEVQQHPVLTSHVLGTGCRATFFNHFKMMISHVEARFVHGSTYVQNWPSRNWESSQWKPGSHLFTEELNTSEIIYKLVCTQCKLTSYSHLLRNVLLLCCWKWHFPGETLHFPSSISYHWGGGGQENSQCMWCSLIHSFTLWVLQNVYQAGRRACLGRPFWMVSA